MRSSSCLVERWHASCRWSGVSDALGRACALPAPVATVTEEEELTEASVGSDLTEAAAESKREVAAVEAGFHV